jgi:hypothetical protein
MAEINKCQVEFEANLTAIKNSKEDEVMAFDDCIEQSRHTIALIKKRCSGKPSASVRTNRIS